MTSLEGVTVETFAPCVGDTFALDAGKAGRLDLRLVSATPSGAAGADGSRDPFTLLFLGPVDPLLPQATYALEHPGLGSLEIFVVPIGRDDDGTRYEAVFA